MNTNTIIPLRGEIWTINFDPTVGAEIQKLRPAVVVSSNALQSLPLRLVAPITEWKPLFDTQFSHVKVVPTKTNGLIKLSAVATLQLRGVSLERFKTKIGILPSSIMQEIAAAIAAVVEYQ